MKKFIFSLVIVLSSFCVQTNAQAPYGTAGSHTAVRLDTAVDNPPYGFYEYLPQNFSTTSGEKYPIVFFYHGIGEKGNGSSDLAKVLKNGPPRRIEAGRHYPAIVISPQATYGYFNGADFLRLYNYFISKYPVDTDRVYVTGLSAGGGGTWRAAEAHPDKIAAIVPICGANRIGNPSAFLQKVPVWAHHNFLDRSVGKGLTIDNVNRIANTSGSVMDVYPFGPGNTVANTDYTMQFDIENQSWSAAMGVIKPEQNMCFTLYKKGNHDAWTKTYGNQAVMDWLFAQNLQNHTLNIPDVTVTENQKVKISVRHTNNELIIDADEAISEIACFDITGRQFLKQKNNTIKTERLPGPIIMIKVKTVQGKQGYSKVIIQ
ncbi:carboxylesterase family protein [Flavivirga eckloniae]|uniref:Phospholipase n=1 Tax=Flavivirga eckloniae TaxID=1803846 RepID=A0A2K9PP08_9FLAO|nr:hypothetical protein [Flavivirga eckloniae]AUP78548.1 hypothetical protein C1H87_07415 [Flavivirga eckloniae]